MYGHKKTLISCLAAAFFVLPGLLAAGAVAKSLPSEACTMLKEQRQILENDNIASRMQKGPLWAKEHLSSEQFRQVMDYLQLVEKVSFRCAGVKKKDGRAGVPLPARNLRRLRNKKVNAQKKVIVQKKITRKKKIIRPKKPVKAARPARKNAAPKPDLGKKKPFIRTKMPISLDRRAELGNRR